MRNKYPGNCCICGEHIPAEKGFFERNNKRMTGIYNKDWLLRCQECVGKGSPWKQNPPDVDKLLGG